MQATSLIIIAISLPDAIHSFHIQIVVTFGWTSSILWTTGFRV